ncbi:hypothetical protein LR48_Vigan503s003800 [Vigna angularis]|uniref:Uncharacterized protein n=1 Tax=Phaseolus angularis TaxID=3914 RepID=A0A0L9TC92_PHAAN|nr:hypothetical protein LR48_Vigan503s003800 [Vigna angularis]
MFQRQVQLIFLVVARRHLRSKEKLEHERGIHISVTFGLLPSSIHFQQPKPCPGLLGAPVILFFIHQTPHDHSPGALAPSLLLIRNHLRNYLQERPSPETVNPYTSRQAHHLYPFTALTPLYSSPPSSSLYHLTANTIIFIPFFFIFISNTCDWVTVVSGGQLSRRSAETSEGVDGIGGWDAVAGSVARWLEAVTPWPPLVSDVPAVAGDFKAGGRWWRELSPARPRRVLVEATVAGSGRGDGEPAERVRDLGSLESV